MSLPVYLGVELADELGNEVWRHEAILQRVENDALEFRALGALPAAPGALPARRAAGDVVLADRREVAAAGAALREPGKQVLGPAMLPELLLDRLLDGRALTNVGQPRLHLVPQSLVDNPQLDDVLDDPGTPGVDAGEALAGLRVLDVPLLVPDEPADIELVVEEPGAPDVMAADRRVGPGRPPGPRTPSAFSSCR